MKYLFVINPIAGGKDKKPFVRLLERVVREHQLDVTQFFTNGKDDVERLGRYLDRERPDCVAAVGGDGTIQLAGKLLAGSPVKLGIIPYGSANGLATEFGIPAVQEESLDVLLNSQHFMEYDLIDINGQTCLHFGDVGINADIVREYERDEERGMMVYAKYLLRQLDSQQRYTFRLRLDNGEEQWREGYMLAFANARYLGTGVLLNPCGRIADGRFELVIVRNFRFGDLIRAGLSSLIADIDYGDSIECISCREAEVFLDAPLTLQIDGEVLGEVTHIKARMLPKTLKVILPEK